MAPSGSDAVAESSTVVGFLMDEPFAGVVIVIIGEALLAPPKIASANCGKSIKGFRLP